MFVERMEVDKLYSFHYLCNRNYSCFHGMGSWVGRWKICWIWSALREAEEKKALQHYLQHLQALNLGEKIHSSGIYSSQAFWASCFMTWCIIADKYLFVCLFVYDFGDKGELDECLVINSLTLCNWLRNTLVSRQSLKSYTHAKGGEQWRGLGNLVKTDGRGTRIETITMTEDLGTFRLLFQKKFHCHRKTKTKSVACEEENAPCIIEYLFHFPPFFLLQLGGCQLYSFPELPPWLWK